MAQVKIYGLQSTIARQREKLSDAIHQAIVETLHLPPEKKFQRFLGLAAEDFIFPADRSSSYLIIEISMFAGRSVETRKALVRALYQTIEQACGISPQDVEITIFESPRENWGIRGKAGDELVLSYPVH